jgi:hypothetical protein
MRINSQRWPDVKHLLDDKLSDEVAPFISVVIEKEDLPLRLAKASGIFHGKNKKKDARILAKAAHALAPDDYKIRVMTDWLNRHEAPLWHFGIIHDQERNKAYEKALNHFVKPGMIVFEIGTGTGILAMLAVRAGAEHVYTCERRADVAEAAKAIIERNGMSDRITVIAKDAYALQLGEEIPERADLFVAEIVDNGLLTEFVLPLTELARRKFLKPEAILLPWRVSARGYLVSGQGQAESFRMSEVMGFDLTPFNRFTPVEISAGKGGGREVYPLSEAVELIAFDLRENAPQEDEVPTSLRVTRSGTAEALMRWLHLDFGGGIVFENAPPQRSSWFPHLHILPEPVKVSSGELMQFTVSHNHVRLFISPTSE